MIRCENRLPEAGSLVERPAAAYRNRMTKTAGTVLADALRLDPKGRAELAREFLASLDGPADPDAASAWADEIRRRVAALESGFAELESWDDATGRIERDHP